MKDMFGNVLQVGDVVFVYDAIFVVVGNYTSENDVIVQRCDYSGGYGEKLSRYAFNAVKLSTEQLESYTNKELFNAIAIS